MSQRVVLNLGKGSFEDGCTTVTAQFWAEEFLPPTQCVGSLPPAPALGQTYEQWRKLYDALYAHMNWRSLGEPESISAAIEIETSDITHISVPEFQQLCQTLSRQLNGWLDAEPFREIDRRLRTQLMPSEEIRVIITAENRQLLRLPWCVWTLFDDYPRAEPALSLPDYQRSLKLPATTRANDVHILAILGDRHGIDVTHDQRSLEQLPNATLNLLVEPDLKTLNAHLWESGYDILFFGGHSSSQEHGRLQINHTDSLTLDQLRYGLKRAIANGLKLAIFNSCDGLGLAWDLADLHIPQVIVMREPVPDRVAQEFLKHFLTAFSGGQSLYLAVREAREKLQTLETQFPCATWLPTICQNPAEPPPAWQDWCQVITPTVADPTSAAISKLPIAPHPEPPILPLQPMTAPKAQGLHRSIGWVIRLMLPLGAAITAAVIGGRSLGLLQPIELWAFDRLLAFRPLESADTRLLVITISEREIQNQDPEALRGSLSDQTLNQLLEILDDYQPRVVGLDIYRDFAAHPDYPELQTRLEQADNLIAICKSLDPVHDETGIRPPPGVPEKRVGFSDFLEDPDGILRRQLISLTPDPASPCTTAYSFSAQIAFQYLGAEGVRADFTPSGDLKLGDTIFPRVERRMGGYQAIDAAGTQLLLNYRALSSPQDIAPQISLTNVLSRQINPELVRDRIVLIGVTANSSQDIWVTPYGTNVADKVPGVFVQAQMISHLISGALNQRPPLGVWHWAGEGLWILGWAWVGGTCIIWVDQRAKHLRTSLLQGIVVMAIATVIMTSISTAALTRGRWIPVIPAGIALIATGAILICIKLDTRP